jgi:hypothetical protein
MFTTLQTSFKPFLIRGGGGGYEVMNSKDVNSKNLCPNYVQEFGLSYFAIAKGLEMRLSVSTATPFSDGSLPNHTKMFELVHMVTSMEDFDLNTHVKK